VTQSTKPKLQKGFRISDSVAIDSRVEKAFHVEVYLLTNKEYLYLFTNLQPGLQFNPRFKKQLIDVQVGKDSFPALVIKEHSRELLVKTINHISAIRGFDAVAGMTELKEMLRRDVIDPLSNPEKFKRYRLSVPNGILLFGPPGCGKTFIVKRLAEELNYSFIELKHSDLASPYIHETVARIGQYFSKAISSSPCVVFVDEISGLVPRRDIISSGGQHKEEEVNEFLIQLDGAGQKGVLVIGATNYPERIDPAVIRSGRMDKRIFVPPPDEEARRAMFQIHLMNRPVSEDIDYDALARMTENYVSSDIELIVTNAARRALSQEEPISNSLLLKEVKSCRPSIDIEDMERLLKMVHLERW